MFKDNPNNDEAVKEAYRYAFRDYKTWNRTINYYRCTTYRNTIELMRPAGGRWNISVRTLHIFGSADTSISVQPAKEERLTFLYRSTDYAICNIPIIATSP